MQQNLMNDLHDILSLLWIHLKDEKKTSFSCDEETYTRFVAFSQKTASLQRAPMKEPVALPKPLEQATPKQPTTQSLPKPKEPDFTNSGSYNNDAIEKMTKERPTPNIDEEPEGFLDKDITSLETVSFKKPFEKLLPRAMQNPTIDISHTRKEVSSLEGMPHLSASSLYADPSKKTGKWAFVFHLSKEKESFFQSVVKATNEKLQVACTSLSFQDSGFLSKLPMYIDEHDFLFFFVDSHLEEHFLEKIRQHIEPYQGTKTAPPFAILGKLQGKPLYAVILGHESHEDLVFKKSLWDRLKSFHAQ